MKTEDVQVGSTIMDHQAAMRVTHRVPRAWAGTYISLQSGSMTGTTTAVWDIDLPRWRHVPFEWAAIANGREERYVWHEDQRSLVREVRPGGCPRCGSRQIVWWVTGAYFQLRCGECSLLIGPVIPATDAAGFLTSIEWRP